MEKKLRMITREDVFEKIEGKEVYLKSGQYIGRITGEGFTEGGGFWTLDSGGKICKKNIPDLYIEV